MVKKRWYDSDPTISMAVSLLHNAAQTDQIKTTDYIFKLLEEQGAVEAYNLAKPLTVTYIFPFARREKLEQSTWRLLEILKNLPKDLQVEMALAMIQFIYRLESGGDIPAMEAAAHFRDQMQTGQGA